MPGRNCTKCLLKYKRKIDKILFAQQETIFKRYDTNVHISFFCIFSKAKETEMKRVITISRQYASGGRTIGKMIADELGIPLYDTQIIKDTMKKTGLSTEIIEASEQRVTNSFLFNLAMSVDDAHNHMKQIEKAEHEIIRGYVEKGPCVIVGRAANFVLEQQEAMNVFVFSSVKSRIAYAVSHYGVDEKQANRMIEQTDRERKRFAMNFYSKEWGNKNNYDLLLNSGRLGIETCVELIVSAVK